MKIFIVPIILSALVGFQIGNIYSNENNRKLRKQCYQKVMETPSSGEDIAKFYGLPEHFRKPSYNAYMAYADYQLNECLKKGK